MSAYQLMDMMRLVGVLRSTGPDFFCRLDLCAGLVCHAVHVGWGVECIAMDQSCVMQVHVVGRELGICGARAGVNICPSSFPLLAYIARSVHAQSYSQSDSQTGDDVQALPTDA